MKHINESIIGKRTSSNGYRMINTIIVCPCDYDYTRIYKKFGIKNQYTNKNIYYITTIDGTRLWLAPITDAIKNDLCALGPRKKFSSTSTYVVGTSLPIDQTISEIENMYEFSRMLHDNRFMEISQEDYIKMLK